MSRVFHLTLLAFSALFAVSANAQPLAYSVNSDSLNGATTDSLYTIDLTTGVEQRKGSLFTGISYQIDTEGLAISADGTLWGIDDDSLKLFPINKDSGSVSYSRQVSLSGFSPFGGNDFGMTFSCDDTLYVSTVRTQSLQRVDKVNGTSEVIGATGALGANISAIAAYGNPTKLYGLGNGQFQNGSTDAPALFSIDTETGVATMVGSLGPAAGGYNQGGLAFDESGVLWAITDRGIVDGALANLPSQVLQIDLETGTASHVHTTHEVGFESLAIAPPSGCEEPEPPPEAYYAGDVAIPALNAGGRWLGILLLLLAGMVILRKRLS